MFAPSPVVAKEKGARQGTSGDDFQVVGIVHPGTLCCARLAECTEHSEFLRGHLPKQTPAVSPLGVTGCDVVPHRQVRVGPPAVCRARKR